jgi:short-subunit dehydrogenase
MPTHRGTALVTGASLGIGRELARVFAENGHPLVLSARSEDKLRELARELETRHGVRVDVVPADLGDPATPKRLFDEVAEKNLRIDYLVNNAGFGTTGPFLETDLGREMEMVRLNVAALTELSHRFGRGMAERRSGGILNIASTAAFQPGPNMAVYYATKAYVLSFSEALAEELRASGVRVAAYCPGPVDTEFARTAGNADSVLFRLGAARPEAVARDAYRSLMRGRAVTVQGVTNWIGVQLLRISPRFLVRRIVAWVNSTG